MVPLRPAWEKPRPGLQLVEDIAIWLKGLAETETAPEEALTWHANWRREGAPLRGAEHLAVQISTLPDEEFGGVSGPIRGRWVQVMRVRRHWIVEVSHEAFDWPRRVYSGDAQAWPGKHSRTGQPWEVELFSSLEAADIAWSWMRTGGVLPVGISHTSDYYHPGG